MLRWIIIITDEDIIITREGLKDGKPPNDCYNCKSYISYKIHHDIRNVKNIGLDEVVDRLKVCNFRFRGVSLKIAKTYSKSVLLQRIIL